MTTNYQRALDLADHIAAVDESPRELVKQLDALGLIAPELPELTIKDNEPTWDLDSFFNYVFICNGWINIGMDGTFYETLDLDEAEHLALALLAAIKHQKENRHES